MEKKKILTVDDEVDIVKGMEVRLKFAGYDVITAYDGLEALNKARSEKPDLIILDLMLPKLDGLKVCALLKSDTRYSRIPIIILTAKAQESDIKLGKEVKADLYLTKPFDIKVLLDNIKELI